jgi:hypothetical protein
MKIIYPLALGVLLMSVISSVKADQIAKPWSVKIGVAWPSQDQAKTDSNTTNLLAGLDYAVSKTSENNPAYNSVYFDYQGGSQNGGHVYSYGLGLSERAYLTPTTAGATAPTFYYGAGIGAYYVDILNTGSLSTSATKTNLGGKLLAGIETNQSYFAEFSYTWIPKAASADPSSLGLLVGVRF